VQVVVNQEAIVDDELPIEGVQDEAARDGIFGNEEHVEPQPSAAQRVEELGEPANAAARLHQPRPRDPNREVGAKKAKSITRRNQQRAYNEWLREQGDAQRAEWARDEEKRKKELMVERERRADIDAKVREKDRQEREARKIKEEAERQAELEATKTATRLIDDALALKNFIGVAEVAGVVKRDSEWVQQFVKKEGIVGTKARDGEKQTIMVTKSGWLVRVNTKTMENVYHQAVVTCDHGEGKVMWNEMGRLVQGVILKG
jgi:hypothetical protein